MKEFWFVLRVWRRFKIKLQLGCFFISFPHSPVTNPAELPGFPLAAHLRPTVLGRWRSGAGRVGAGWYYSTDRKAGTGPGPDHSPVGAPQQQPGGKDGPFPYRPNHRPRNSGDLWSPGIRPHEASRWRHVKGESEEKIMNARLGRSFHRVGS